MASPIPSIALAPYPRYSEDEMRLRAKAHSNESIARTQAHSRANTHCCANATRRAVADRRE